MARVSLHTQDPEPSDEENDACEHIYCSLVKITYFFSLLSLLSLMMFYCISSGTESATIMDLLALNPALDPALNPSLTPTVIMPVKKTKKTRERESHLKS